MYNITLCPADIIVFCVIVVGFPVLIAPKYPVPIVVKLVIVAVVADKVSMFAVPPIKALFHFLTLLPKLKSLDALVGIKLELILSVKDALFAEILFIFAVQLINKFFHSNPEAPKS